MKKYGKNLSNLSGIERPGIVHRLDKDTSGLLLIAKNNKTHKLLQEKFKKREISADLKLRIKYGIEHETKHFKLFKNKNNPSVTINDKLTDEKRFEATKQALTKGYKLIYKAYFIEKNFRGEADFLLKVNTKSDLGNYSYEVYDTKITKNLTHNKKIYQTVIFYIFRLIKFTDVANKTVILF